MAHIHTGKGEHDATASAFIVRLDTPEPQLLLHMHKKLGKLLQIGGHIELHENPWQAILHEITEDSGFALHQLLILQPKQRLRSLSGTRLHPVAVCQSTHNFGDTDEHKHSDTVYAFIADGAPEHMPDDGESRDLRWIGAAELANLPDDVVIPNVREIGLYVLAECVPTWERVSLDTYTR